MGLLGGEDTVQIVGLELVCSFINSNFIHIRTYMKNNMNRKAKAIWRQH